MSIEDDEILQGFIEESLEHLADIENDLLAIEDGGPALVATACFSLPLLILGKNLAWVKPILVMTLEMSLLMHRENILAC